MLKKRKKKPKDVQGPSEAMKKYVEILQNDGGSAAGGIPIEKLGPALEAGATDAARKAPRTTDSAKLKLSTRKFIKGDLQVRKGLFASLKPPFCESSLATRARALAEGLGQRTSADAAV